MQKVIGVTELQRRFQTIFDEVTHDDVPYVLTRDSQPEAALIPYKTFLRLLALQDDELMVEFDRLIAQVDEHNAIYSDTEIEADIATAVAEVRRDTRSR